MVIHATCEEPKGEKSEVAPNKRPEVREAGIVISAATQVDGRTKTGGMLAVKTIEPHGVNAVDVQGEWEVVKMAVGSGATETVMGEDMLEGTETKIGDAAKRGVEYEVAN